jgi:hypothetical protein
LYVYQGQVRLDAPDALASTVHTLTAGEARRIDADGAVTSIRLSTARFAPGLIDNVDIPIDLAEWTLPETLGQWTLNNIEGASVAGDQLAGRAGAGDPHAQDAMIFRTDLHIEGSRYPYIEVQLAADADSGGAELFWGVAGQGMFAAGRSVRFGGSDGRMKTYVIDMSRELRWSNQRITGLRLDPVSGKDHAGFKLRNVRLLASLPYAMDQLRPVHAKFNVPGIPVYQRIEPTPGSVKEQEP